MPVSHQIAGHLQVCQAGWQGGRQHAHIRRPGSGTNVVSDGKLLQAVQPAQVSQVC